MMGMQERQQEGMQNRMQDDTMRRDQGGEQHREGSVARTIEEQTAKLPSDLFLWAAVGSMATSCLLHMSGKKHEGLFIGQWAAPLLLFGIYNKIVKVAGSDR